MVRSVQGRKTGWNVGDKGETSQVQPGRTLALSHRHRIQGRDREGTTVQWAVVWDGKGTKGGFLGPHGQLIGWNVMAMVRSQIKRAMTHPYRLTASISCALVYTSCEWQLLVWALQDTSVLLQSAPSSG